MKKNLTPALCAVLAAALLAGCGTAAGFARSFDASSEISVVSREDGSGTRSAFVALFGVEETDGEGNTLDNTTLEAIITNNTSVMLATVAGDPHAIGYVSLGSLNESVKALEIDGAAPGADTIRQGEYTIARPFLAAAKPGMSEAAADFLAYILSREGQAVVEETGYVPLENAEPYAGGKPEGKVVVAGSSSVSPVMEKLKEAYQLENPGAVIEIQTSDSSTGMAGAIGGLCDIGMASRELKDSERQAGLEATVIARDGIAVIVNRQNPLSGLSARQVNAIFTGDAFFWNEV